MKLLFVALTKHQYRYFIKLSGHLKADCKILFFPSLSLDLKALFSNSGLDTEKIKMNKFKEVEIKYSNPLVRQLYKLFLKVQIPLVIAATTKALRRFDPDCVVLWNGKKFHQAIVATLAEKYGKRRLFFENGLLPDTTQMDFQGVNAANSVPRDIQFYQSLHIEDSCVLPEKLQVRKRKKSSIKMLYENSLPAHYIFVPFQVAYDTQIMQHSPWIKDMYVFFDLICEMAQKSGLHFVIKEHPSDRVSDYSSLYQRLPENVSFSEENTQKLIENSDAVMTINSTVGIEGLLFQKRVIVLGEAFFAIEGIVKTAHNKETLYTILKNLNNWELERDLVERFLKYLYCIYLVPDSWKTPSPRHYQVIQERLEKELKNV